MNEQAKEAGRKAALALVKKVRGDQPPLEAKETVNNINIDTDALVEALTVLAENQLDLNPVVEALGSLPSVDLSPVIEALTNLELTNTVNVDLEAVVGELKKISAQQKQDNQPMLDRLDSLIAVMKKQNDTMNRLISIARKPKTVKYDGLGRIIEIKVQE